MYSLFAVTVPGLEAITQRELSDLGLTAHPAKSIGIHGDLKEDAGGVEFETSLTDLYRANLYLRTANRIIARVGEFNAPGFDELKKHTARLPWEQYLRPGMAVAVRVTCRKSRLYHSDAVAREVVAAIDSRLGKPVHLAKFDEDAKPLPQLIVVRLVHDRCTISMDTTGELLHRRGYRLETAKAPLRETLAAGLLLASAWQPSTPLLDPFCGSGTLPIEAALIARRIAPGKNRRFAFMNWPNFDPSAWSAVYKQAVTLEQPASAPILGSDRDEGAIRIATANAERAGVLESIEFSCRAFSAIEPPSEKGWVVTNPPYGVRVSPGHDLRNLYTHLGDVLRNLCPGWKAGILCSDPILLGHTRLAVERELPFVNGGIPVKFRISQIEE
jgi:putative N6-adenine-specific DNA methylase